MSTNSTNDQDTVKKSQLFWVCRRTVNWPVQLLTSDGEMSQIKFFNGEKTILTVNSSKLIPFKEVTSTPKGRSSDWKQGYIEALNLWRNCPGEYVEN